jgi:hypothetical protein
MTTVFPTPRYTPEGYPYYQPEDLQTQPDAPTSQPGSEDLSKLSDEELLSLYKGVDPSGSPTAAPVQADITKLSDDELKALYAKQSAPVSSVEDTSAKAPAAATLGSTILGGLELANPIKNPFVPPRAISALVGQNEPSAEPNVSDPTQHSTVYNTVVDWAKGFNHELARALALPDEAANEVLHMVGLGVYKPGEKVAETEAKMKALGINTGAVDSLANRIGRENFKGLATLATLGMAAPAMVAKQGTGVVANITRDMGATLSKYPGLSQFLQMGGDAGAIVAQDATKSNNPAIATAGALGGALATSATIKGGQKLLRGAGSIVESLAGSKALSVPSAAEAFLNRSKTAPFSSEPIRAYNADPEIARVFAEQAVEAANLRMNRALEDAVNSVPTKGMSPEQAQVYLRQSLDRAERIGNRIVSSFWERVPKKAPVPMSDIRRQVDVMRDELVDKPSQAPLEFMDKLYNLSLPIRDPATGKMIPSLPSIERLRDLRGEIRRARVSESASVAPNDGLVRNYNRLESIIDRGIQDAIPGDVSIDQARKVSILYHDLFSRSNLNSVMSRNATGAERVDPEQTLTKLMGRYKGVQDITDVRNSLVYKRAPGGLSYAVTKEERAQLQQLTIDAENAIREEFRQAASEGGPQAASAFVGKHEKTIRSLAQVSAELELASNKINQTLAEQKALQAGALAKYASTNPNVSVKRILVAAKPSAMANEVMLTLRNDPDAIQGFRASFIDELLVRTKGDPTKVKLFLDQPGRSELYQTVLGPNDFARLKRNLNIAYRIANGDEQLTTRHLIGRVSILARIIGAQVGRQISHMTGGGTIQVPGIVSRSFAKTSERLFKASNPTDLFVQSILDPKWEKLLLSREPRTTLEGRNYVKTMRRLLAITEGNRIAADRKLEAQGNE